jgi:hypothetical protein
MTESSPTPHGDNSAESLAQAVGGNALNADGRATENPDKFGAGTPEGDPESNTNEETEQDADALASSSD